jgi:serine/threonine-protein kinase
VGIVVWPVLYAADIALALVAGQPGALVEVTLHRALSWALWILLYRLVRGSAPLSIRVLTALDYGVPAVIGVSSAARALIFGGVSLWVILGVGVAALTRAALLPSRWARGFTASLGAYVAFAATIAIAYPSHADLHEELAAIPVAGIVQVALYSVLGLAIASYASHLAWKARTEMFESRRLGNYTLRARIGKGAHGDVWLARQEPLGRDVAVKVLRDASGSAAESVRRFEREARTASQLSHPNTIRIFDYGATLDGVSFLVMEFLDGSDLDAIVDAVGPLPPARAVHLARQMCGALAEAHEAGIVHRDIKPANVFVTHVAGEWDVVKVLDFGVAGFSHRRGDITRADRALGTPAFMAPETIAGEQADQRSDVYSLGAVLYWMLTKEPLFSCRTLGELLRAAAERVPEPPSARSGREVPAALDAVVLRCLAKAPGDRFPTMRELDAALAACDAGTWTPGDAETAWSSAHPPHEGRALRTA